MRIALLSYEYPPETGFGGIGTYTFYQARALARLGHDVHVFAGTQSAERRTYRDGNVTVTRTRSVGFVERLMPHVDARGLGWFKNRVQNAANSFAALRRELRRGRFDVVEMPECGAEGAIVNHCLDLPTVVRLHSPAELIMPTYGTKAADRALTAMVERLGMTGARAMSSCSHWLAEEVRRQGIVSRPIAVIPNGIDLSLFDQGEGIDIHQRFAVPRDRLKIFFANRLEARKGIHVVKELLLPVLERHPHVTFVLAGADPDGIVERELVPMLAARGLAQGLVHLGRLPLHEVRACLKQTDVFLLPSIWENAPYSLLEAMAAGKAIVASDCGGVPEILRHDVDGLVARTGDAAAFGRAIDRLMTDGTRLRLGQSARARVEARYTDDVVARRSLDFYAWALGASVGRQVPTTVRPSIVLGPDNWFQAAWMRGAGSGERPLVGEAFAQLGLDELAFVQAVLGRVYWANRGGVGTDEAACLDELAAAHRQLAVAAQAAGSPPAAGARLAMPALSHPIFGDDVSAEAVLAELWRLGDSPVLTEWMLREIGMPDFVEQATRRQAFRRLAVEAGRRCPGEVSFGVLRRIYRTVGTAARVVQQDQEFIAAHREGAAFAAVVAELGLHAPLQRPAAFPPARRRKPGKAAAAEITVLIPSYRHEAYVGRAIESVLAQSHGNLRVLVVDDGSPDGTVAAARAIADPRVEVRSNASNLGLGGSIQAALATITTPYVALLNSDDVFHPERLERCLEVLEADATAALVATKLVVMDGKERRLQGDTTCVVDLGPAAHGWVRWYERVTAGLAPMDWSGLPALLRHNHLATSSNVVCRTSFLQQQAATFAPLKYCLDWSLFLHAAIAGSLRCVPEALLGYRLHATNTVWFGDDTRPGYVHEVNAVVVDALRTQLARRRSEGAAADVVAEELAALLLGSVVAHGETDGLALCLAGLLADAGTVPAAFRAPALTRLAEQALAARRGATASASSERLDRHVVEALLRRTRELEPAVGRLQHELTLARQQHEDADALRQSLAAADLATAQARTDEAAGQRTLEGVRGELADTRAVLARTAQDLATAQDKIVTQQADLLRGTERLVRNREELDAVARELERVRDQLAESRSSDEGARVELRQARSEQLILQSRLEERLRELERISRELQDIERRHREAAEWASRRHLADQAQAQQLAGGLEYRFGRLFLHKLPFGGVVKTLLRFGTGLRVGSGRLAAGLRKQLPGRKPARVVFACEGAFPSPAATQLAAQMKALRDDGFDARVVCWEKGGEHHFDRALLPMFDWRTCLATDAALLARDRRFFAKRRPDQTQRLLDFPLPAGALALAFSFARTARSLGAGYVQAQGLGAAGFAVHAAAVLTGVRFGLQLGADDLPLLAAQPWRDVVAGAAAVLVDSEAMAAAVRAAMGQGLPALLVQPPLVHRLPAAAGGREGPFACIGPFADARGLFVLAEACKRAVDRGATLRVEVLDTGRPSVASAMAIDWTRGRLAELGILDRFVFRDRGDAAQVAGLLARAGAVIDVHVGPPHGLPGLTYPAVAAMAAGLPLVAFAGALGDAVQEGQGARLVPFDEAEAFAAVLVDVAAQRDRRAELGAIGRKRYDARFEPGIVAAELCARVRALLNASCS